MKVRRGFPFADLALIVLIASTWAVFLTTKQSRTEASKLLARRVYPPTINGFKLNLDPYSVQLSAWPPDPQASTRRATLIIAVDDSCVVCKLTYPAWASLINQARWRAGVEAIVITFHGDALAARLGDLLRGHNVPHRLLRVKENHIFGVATGIKAVPFTALVDNSDRIRLVAVELNEHAVRAFSQAIAGETENRGTADYFSVLHTQQKEVNP
ncbi:MAG TPA: hypothetical protein PLA43_20385 [Bryobacteraceae bacterium]|jgi:hypothetical protein|nr:hypothetical protein [Bryobacteraceae bacterium]HPU74318.1 hypothetical protein [Bryobacteraceae bacterium]